MTPRFLTIEDFAEALRIQPVTVRSWMHRGKLDYYKVGRLVRIDERELERVLEEGRRATRRRMPDGMGVAK
jgi:excisionase family DNA binding protein